MKPTPFYPRTSELCDSHSWADWSGYLTANSYDKDHTHEYLAVRTACAVFDASPLYKYLIHGPDAMRLMNRIVTQDVSRCVVGRAMYTPWCDDEGKIIDDGILVRLEEQVFRLTAADPTLFWLEDNAVGLDVTAEDITEGLGVLALQGPTSRELLKTLSNADFDSLGYFRILNTDLAGIPVTVSRTGYTGDLGFEIWVEPHRALDLWDALFEAGEAYALRPFGENALDMARIEAGLLLTEVDFHSSKKVLHEFEKSTPLELGLGWTVKLDQEYFVGQSALKRERQGGSAWATVGLEVDLNALEGIYAEFGMPLYLPYESWGDAVPVFANGRQVGKATSGTWSPILKKYIAISRLRPRYARPGTPVEMEVTIDAQRKHAKAMVGKLPFFDPPRKRD
ncbi:MAG: aminomethyltransferase family protein [Anaerolineales bacterium]